MFDKAATCALALVVVGLTGCGMSAPTLSVSPFPTLQLATPTAPGSQGEATASQSYSPSPSSTNTVSVSDLAIDIQDIPKRYTHHLGAFRSLGDQLIWSASAGSDHRGNGSLYRYVPGAAEPELVYMNPRENCYLAYLAGSSAGYAFSEYCLTDQGQPTDPQWRVWFTPGPGEDLDLLDEGGDPNQLSPPQVDMEGNVVAWTPDYGTGDDRLSQLRTVMIERPSHPTTLVSDLVSKSSVAFPVLHDNEVWYSHSNNDWENDIAYPQVERIDLGQPNGPPETFGADMRAFMEDVNDQVVVWRSDTSGYLNPYSRGLLTIYWRETGQIEPLPIPGDPRRAEVISYPSVGDRFVAWFDDERSRLWLFDLEERQFRRVAEWPTGDAGSVMRSVDGNLLAFIYYAGENEAVLRWAVLPD